jgi:hypothetical protein
MKSSTHDVSILEAMHRYRDNRDRFRSIPGVDFLDNP